MNNFDFVQAKNEGEALEKLTGPSVVMPLAGGTNLMVNLKRAPLDADLVVDLSRIESLQSIAEENGTVILGSGVTFADLLEWRPGGALEALMRPMAMAFAGPLIRNLATLGGNICDASPAADLSPPLLALAANVKLESSGGATRVLPLEEFFQGVRRTARQPDELLTSIELPRPDPADQAFYYKLGKRKADAISIVSIAILLRRKSEKVEHVHIALGAVAPVAMRAPEAEAVLLGDELSEQTITTAAAAAAEESSPIDDFRATADYRRQMVDVLVRRGLEQIMLRE
jgi:CO/xanthine dehydrogenase FAD-binding subunit